MNTPTTTAFEQHFAGAKIETEPGQGYLGTGQTVYKVRWTWKGTDRSDGGAISCGFGPSGLKMAQRLLPAIESGKLFDELAVRTDVNGLTYVAGWPRVMGRHLNANLKRAGF